MGSSKKSPAIFAGLIGIGAFGIPVQSYALELPSGISIPFDLPNSLEVPFTFEDFAASPAVYFVLGCLAGACVSGLIVFMVQKHAQKVLRERFTNELNEARAATRQAEDEVAEAQSQLSEVSQDSDATEVSQPTTPFVNPYSNTGAFAVRPGVKPVPLPVEQDASSPFVSARLDALLPHVSEASFVDSSEVVRSSVAQGTQTKDLSGGSSSAASGFAGVGATAAAPASGGPDAPQGFTAQVAVNSAVASEPRSPEPTVPPSPTSSQPTHASEITTTYAERQANRKRGVFSLLSERLGSNMMNDIPVIERADGTVADIGASWWSDTMGSTMTQLTATNDAAALGMRPADETTDLEAAATISANAERRERARNLSARLPVIEEQPLYPDTTARLQESRGDDGSAAGEEEDLFEQAMRNMDDELPNPGITTSVDAMPSGVVPAEALGNFQKTGAMPVHDGNPYGKSYIENLVREEMERGQADEPEMRRRSWQVMDGGAAKPAATSPSPSETTPTGHDSSYRPKHMRRKQA